jgi:hypothetical protein
LVISYNKSSCASEIDIQANSRLKHKIVQAFDFRFNLKQRLSLGNLSLYNNCRSECCGSNQILED